MKGRLWFRALARLRRAGRRARTPTPSGRVFSLVVCIFAGFMIVTGAINAHGGDLRPNRNTDLAGLVESEARHNAELAGRVANLRTEVDTLTRANNENPLSQDELDAAAANAGMTPVRGPAVAVTLADAPLAVKPAGVDEDLLVVHQQDIQAIANALWAGGAEAMTIQGQRVTAQTGVKCVGNTVVLQGVPYAPPYAIVAIGDQNRLEAALANSSYVKIYLQYVRAYGLGYQQERVAEAALPAYRGGLDISAQRVS